MSLTDDLQEISGVGEATAEKIVAIVEEQDSGGVDPAEIETALEFMDRNATRAARSVLEGALE